jgi:hypothetical protein
MQRVSNAKEENFVSQKNMGFFSLARTITETQLLCAGKMHGFSMARDCTVSTVL